jgi:pilus assembly protein CpaD
MTRISLILALAAAGLSACATPTAPGAVVDARTPTEQWRAELSSQPEEVQLAIHAAGLSPTQADALAIFVADWRDAGGGMITIQTPAEGVEAGAAYRSSEATRNFLAGQGVAPDQIRVVGYRPDVEGKPPLRVGYLRNTLSIPECGREWTNVAHSADNAVQPNFGCAVTANMAAQIANPADLAGPRAMSGPDAQRRVLTLEKYRKGEVTSSAKDNQAAGSVSQAVN